MPSCRWHVEGMLGGREHRSSKCFACRIARRAPPSCLDSGAMFVTLPLPCDHRWPNRSVHSILNGCMNAELAVRWILVGLAGAPVPRFMRGPECKSPRREASSHCPGQHPLMHRRLERLSCTSNPAESWDTVQFQFEWFSRTSMQNQLYRQVKLLRITGVCCQFLRSRLAPLAIFSRLPCATLYRLYTAIQSFEALPRFVPCPASPGSPFFPAQTFP